MAKVPWRTGSAHSPLSCQRGVNAGGGCQGYQPTLAQEDPASPIGLEQNDRHSMNQAPSTSSSLHSCRNSNHGIAIRRLHTSFPWLQVCSTSKTSRSMTFVRTTVLAARKRFGNSMLLVPTRCSVVNGWSWWGSYKSCWPYKWTETVLWYISCPRLMKSNEKEKERRKQTSNPVGILVSKRFLAMSMFRSSVLDTGLCPLIVTHLCLKDKLNLWAAFPGIDLAEVVAPSPLKKRYRTDALRQLLCQQRTQDDIHSFHNINPENFKVGLLENDSTVSIGVLYFKGALGVEIYYIMLQQGSAFLDWYSSRCLLAKLFCKWIHCNVELHSLATAVQGIFNQSQNTGREINNSSPCTRIGKSTLKGILCWSLSKLGLSHSVNNRRKGSWNSIPPETSCRPGTTTTWWIMCIDEGSDSSCRPESSDAHSADNQGKYKMSRNTVSPSKWSAAVDKPPTAGKIQT